MLYLSQSKVMIGTLATQILSMKIFSATNYSGFNLAFWIAYKDSLMIGCQSKQKMQHVIVFSVMYEKTLVPARCYPLKARILII